MSSDFAVSGPATPTPAGAADRESEQFYAALPVVTGFENLADPRAYAPLPDDWVIGLADVVRSTDAIQAGRYKAVNTAGAAAISAVSNALGTLDFPYVFAGDGMCYAVAPSQADRARRALASSIAWVGADLQLTLRGGETTVAQIRAAGHDVRVARYAASDDVDYAMFSGGGLVWAEAELKAGGLTPVRPDATTRPDLNGLSCRFNPVAARHGLILSIIVSPRGDRDSAPFQRLITDLLHDIDASPDAALPLRENALVLPWPPRGFKTEVKLQRKDGQSLLSSYFAVAAWTMLSALVFRSGRTIGRFSPTAYRHQLVANSDHRKFEDRLMMTLDCSPAVAEAIDGLLSTAREAGIADYGLQRQELALITCVVPSPTRRDHVHFVDGGAGGYALAALNLKSSIGAAV